MPAKKNRAREKRIGMEIIVDCYGPEEQAMGWYCYLESHLKFPFIAHCIARRDVSPLKVGDEVEVIDMPPETECEHEMFVMIRWDKEHLGVPLAQLRPARGVDAATKQAVEDWHYWVGMGYSY